MLDGDALGASGVLRLQAEAYGDDQCVVRVDRGEQHAERDDVVEVLDERPGGSPGSGW